MPGVREQRSRDEGPAVLALGLLETDVERVDRLVLRAARGAPADLGRDVAVDEDVQLRLGEQLERRAPPDCVGEEGRLFRIPSSISMA